VHPKDLTFPTLDARKIFNKKLRSDHQTESPEYEGRDREIESCLSAPLQNDPLDDPRHRHHIAGQAGRASAEARAGWGGLPVTFSR
jgi:hypothetical protein